MSSENVDVSLAWAAFTASNEVRSYMFKDEEFIGRCEDSMIVIADTNVSRKHCVIRRSDDNKFTICDLSNCGTLVNGKKLEKNVPVEIFDSDEIAIINRYLFKFRINKSRVKTEEMRFSMQEELTSLDHTHLERLEKINDEMDKTGKELNGLKEEMGRQEKAPKTKKAKESLSSLQRTINMLNDKVVMQQKAKEDLERRHKLERDELESRWKSDIEELRRKLKDCEEEKTRWEGTTQEMKKLLTETKINLKESELEQSRLFEEKEEVQKQLVVLTKNTKTIEKKIEETTKKVEEEEKKMKKLLEENEQFKSEMENMEEGLLCSICTELFIEPYVLDCHHSFCKVCIDEWKRKKKVCPVCRKEFKTCQKAFFYDAIIDSTVRLMTAEGRRYREELVKQRKEGKAIARAKKRKHSTQPSDSDSLVGVQGPSTSRAHNVSQPAVSVDPFTWNRPARGSRRTRRTAPPVEGRQALREVEPQVPVAAIDLTNLPLAPIASITGTIDLTTP